MEMNTVTEIERGPDYDAVKAKQNAAWASGDYAKIGVTLQIVGESLAEAMDLKTDAKVLDVAAGRGIATEITGGHRVARTAGRLRIEPQRPDVDHS